jgi:hypothetical protein
MIDHPIYRRIIVICCIAALSIYALSAHAAVNYRQAWQTYLSRPTPTRFDVVYPHEKCFQQAAGHHNLPVSLLMAVARGESNFNSQAVSKANCHGVMQIQWPGTAKHLDITRKADLYRPCTNIMAGAAYLKQLLGRYQNNLHRALAAYNYGPGRIGQTGALPKGARWYSQYIYHHLQYILKTAASDQPSSKPRPYRGENRKTIITFSRPFRAQGFYDYIRKKAPAVQLDWFRLDMNNFAVVLFYEDAAELETARAAMLELGFDID